MIYDSEKDKWYILTRNWRGKLKLEDVTLEGVRKFLAKEDYIWSDEKGLTKAKFKEPKTPE